MRKKIVVPSLDVITIGNIHWSSLFGRKARVNTERVHSGHPIILLRSNKFNRISKKNLFYVHVTIVANFSLILQSFLPCLQRFLSLLPVSKQTNYVTDKPCEWLRKRLKPCKKETSARRLSHSKRNQRRGFCNIFGGKQGALWSIYKWWIAYYVANYRTHLKVDFHCHIILMCVCT